MLAIQPKLSLGVQKMKPKNKSFLLLKWTFIVRGFDVKPETMADANSNSDDVDFSLSCSCPMSTRSEVFELLLVGQGKRRDQQEID